MLNPYETPVLVDEPYYGDQSSFCRGACTFVLTLSVVGVLLPLLERDLATVFRYAHYWPHGVLRWWPIATLAGLHVAPLLMAGGLTAMNHKPIDVH